MTIPLKKTHERNFVEEAAKRLGKSWDIGLDRENPDFVIKEGDQQFGLEVCEIFTGQENRSGSINKKGESDRQQAIKAVQHEYEAAQNILLNVRFVGDICAQNLAKVVPAIVTQNLAPAPVGHRVVIDIDTGLRAGLRVHVTRAFRADWISVNDRVGWVDRNPMPHITAIVEKKSQKLLRYTDAAGSDIRLLVVSNSIHNSGKLRLEAQARLDKKGFQVIYYFSYPEGVVVFD